MQPLGGFVVLDLTDLKGQLCGKILADLGMEVIKIEPPDGDPVRRLAPFKDDKPHVESSLVFAWFNSQKKSLTLSLESQQGRDLFLRLVEGVDVVVESFRPGYLRKLGLDYLALSSRNSRLVMASITGFGQNGPHSQYEISDIVMLAMGGLMFISGDPDAPPVRAPETQAYYAASLNAALGVVLALYERKNSGRGQHVDVAIQECLATEEQIVSLYTTTGIILRRFGSQHKQVAPANVFPCREGYVYLFVTERHWRPFLNFMKAHQDYPPEFEQPEWESNAFRRARAQQINEVVSQFTEGFYKEELTTLMQSHGIPCLPVNSPGEFVQDEHIQTRGFLVSVQHPILGSYQQPGAPFRFNGLPCQSLAAPTLGEHNEEVFCDRLGLSREDLLILRQMRVI